MPDYGLTPKGPNIKRLDVILEEMHSSLTEKLGINTRQNPQSLLNHLLTNVADKIAELWEYGSDIYYSQYPATAEGISLDNAAQYGGSTRGSPAPSYYHVLCTGIDGTVIPSGTLIASDTNPATQLVISEQKEITRSFFNKAAVKVTSTQLSGVFTVALNGNPYSITPTGTPTTTDVLKALSAAINDDAFLVSVDEEAALLRIEAVDEASANVLLLSENLTTDTVGSVITFATEEAGDILLPNGVITKIVKAVPGLQSVVNVGSYIAGQLTETDTEFRQSYADKIFSMSSRMLESIRSAILDNCQGVTSVAPYENDSNEVDDMGRWPHSVEVVVDGGDANEIARQILNTKAGGINTFGSVEVSVPGEYGEEITVRFNRPTYLKVWMRVGVTMSRSSTLPSNYADLIKAAIPASARRAGGHPAKRTFQAIRIEVNDELGVLRRCIEDSFDRLAPGGRFCIITFHSLEDRLVKQMFAQFTKGCTCPPEFPVCVCGKTPRARLVSRKPVEPSAQEIERNNRSRSAKLRVLEKIETV